MSDVAETDGLTMRGIVVPTHWGPDGNVTRLAILTRDEGEYEVAPGGVGRGLINHLRREVLAQAVAAKDSDPGKRVVVTSFAVLEWNDSMDDIIATLEVEEP
jgi:hypothetical protein